MTCADGDTGTLRVAEATRTGTRVDVTINVAQRSSLPVATIRSMRVAEDNADAARLAFKGPDGVYHDGNIVTSAGGRAAASFAWREARSRHNTSAPDLWVGDFCVRT